MHLACERECVFQYGRMRIHGASLKVLLQQVTASRNRTSKIAFVAILAALVPAPASPATTTPPANMGYLVGAW